MSKIKKTDETILKDLLISILLSSIVYILYYSEYINTIPFSDGLFLGVISLLVSIVFFIWNPKKLGAIYNLFYKNFKNILIFKIYFLFFLALSYVIIYFFRGLSFIIDFLLLIVLFLIVFRLFNLLNLIFRFWLVSDFENKTTYVQKEEMKNEKN